MSDNRLYQEMCEKYGETVGRIAFFFHEKGLKISVKAGHYGLEELTLLDVEKSLSLSLMVDFPEERGQKSLSSDLQFYISPDGASKE